MARKTAPKTTGDEKPAHRATAESVPAAEALSFLKETRGVVSWTARDLAESLRINSGEAGRVISVLELQGYVKRRGAGEWMTTVSGESISGSKPPRLTLEKAEEALSALGRRIDEVNRDSSAPYKIVDAVAFGDFLKGRTRVQAPDVGIRLVPRGRAVHAPGSAEERKAQRQILKQLRGRSATLQIRPYEEWMSARSHRSLVGR